MVALRRLRAEEKGQILPLLLVLLVAILSIGVMLFQVGRASDLRSRAQTAADAAALAAAENMRDQFQSQAGVSGAASLGAVDEGLMRNAAADYANRNGGRLRSLERDGYQVTVTVDTEEKLGTPAEEIGEEAEEARGSAEARAELAFVASSLGGGGNLGPLPGRGSGNIPDEDWDELGEEIDKPPGPKDLVALGRFLLDHGFAVGENAALGAPPAPPPSHSANGFHYRFGNSGAIDVNFDPTGDFEMSKINPIVRPVQKLGFRTIWLTEDHYDHIHIDIANSGNIGLGGPFGLVALEDAVLDVKLVSLEDTTSFGPYAIPAYIVECESGGDYTAVNPTSGAGGAYQILPSTWRYYGGSGLPQDAPPAEQDRIARLIWENDGPSAWECA